MIVLVKISKYLYIHFSVILLFLVCYFNRNLDILAISYGSIFIHELAHLIAATCIGLKSSHIVLYAFGVNLKLKNTIVYSFSDEIILYLAGPLVNAIITIISMPYIKNGNYWNLIYWNNLMLFLFNLIPVGPMDGGIVFKKILERRIGYSRGQKITKIISIILVSALVCTEIYLIKISKFNFSIIFICAFLIGNIFTNKEKYHISFLKELMYYKKKNNFKIKKAKSILVKYDADLKEVAKTFSPANTYIVFMENKYGKIKEIFTEKEIVEKILK